MAMPIQQAQGKQNITKRLIMWAVVALLILLIFLIKQLTNFGQVEVQWNEAIAYGVILLVAGGFYELWQWLKTRTRTYRIAFSVGLTGVFLLGWVSGAVGVIGSENNPANLMYWSIPVVLLIGSLISRFKPSPMARTLFTTAIVQMLIPVVALFIWPANASWGEAGVVGIIVFNTIFAVLFFVASALLFRREASYSKVTS